MTVDAATVQGLATRAVERTLGQAPSSVLLDAPDRVILVLDGVQVEGRLVVDAGRLMLAFPPLGRVAVVDRPSGPSIALTSVAIVSDGSVEVSGTLDARSLGLGG
jgi:hypothetical protein